MKELAMTIITENPQFPNPEHTIWICLFETDDRMCMALAPEFLLGAALVEKPPGVARYYWRIDKPVLNPWIPPTVTGYPVGGFYCAKAGDHYQQASRWEIVQHDHVMQQVQTLADATVAVGGVLLKWAHDTGMIPKEVTL